MGVSRNYGAVSWCNSSIKPVYEVCAGILLCKCINRFLPYITRSIPNWPQLRSVRHHNHISSIDSSYYRYPGACKNKKNKKIKKLVLRKNRAKLMFIQNGSLKSKNFASRDALSVSTLVWLYRKRAKHMEFLFHFLFLLMFDVISIG